MTAWTMADSVKPSISDHTICQVIDPATARAWPSASRTRIAGSRIVGGPRRGDGQQLPQAVLEQLVREAVAQPVEDHAAVLAEADQPGQPQHLQRVGNLVLGG